MASMRQNIARALIKTRIGLTTSELSDDLQLKPAVINMDLAKMAIECTAEKGEYLEGEGQIWKITEKGVETYGIKSDLETVPIVAKSVLEQIDEKKVEIPISTRRLNPEESPIWKIVEQAGADFIEILNSKKAKPIENIDYKIATLESLADIYNPKISATLREIVADLRG